jgi:MFS family permease
MARGGAKVSGAHPDGPGTAVGDVRLGREFGKLWSAATVSAMGNGVSLSAAPLLASTLTDDPRWIAGVTMALTLPFVLLGVPAGVLVDRFDRRRSMAWIDFFRAGVLAAFSLLVLTGAGGLAAIYVCFFLVGTCETYYRNASQALVPAVVPRELLVPANGRLVSAQTAANQFAGPLAGSALFVLAPGLPFGVDALTFLASAVLLTRLRTRAPATPRAAGTGAGAGTAPGPGSSPPARLLADMATGVRWLWRHRLLRNLAAMAAVLNLVSGGTVAVLVVHAHRVLGLGDFGYGVLLACEAAGAAVAAWAAPAVVRAVGRDWALVVVAAGQAATGVLFWLARLPWLAGAALALGACAAVTWDVVVVALRQTLIPDHLQGRVNSVYRLVAWGSLPLGAALAGTIAYLFGTPAVFGLGAAVMVLAGVRLALGARRRWISAALVAPDPREHG